MEGCSPSKLIYRLRVLMVDVAPSVWRVVQLPGNVTFDRLHLILRAAMGWTNSHLYEFLIEPMEHGYPDHEYNMPIIESERVRMHEVMRQPRAAWGHLRDVGDD